MYHRPKTANYLRILFFLICLPHISTGQKTLDLVAIESQSLDDFLVVFHTPDTLNGEEAWQRISSDQMESINIRSNAGMKNVEDAYWVVTQWKNKSDQKSTYYLEVNYPQLDIVSLYKIASDSVLLIYHTGDSFPFEKRPVLSRNFVFPITLQAGETSSFLINLDKRKSSIRFPMTVYSEPAFYKSLFNENLVNSILFGFLIIVILVSLLIGILVKKRVFLVYSFYVFAFALWLFTRLGYSYQFITSDFPELNRHFLPVLAQLSIMALLWYVQIFFDTKKHLPLTDKLMSGIQIFFVGGYVFWMLFPNIMVYFAVQLFPVRYFLTFLVIVIAIGTAIHHWKIDTFKSLMFLCAYFIFFLTIGGKILMEYAVISDSRLTVDPIVVGFVVEIMVLSSVMGISLKRILKNQHKEESEKEESKPERYLTLKSKAVLTLDQIIYIKSDGHYLEYKLDDQVYPEIDRNKIKELLLELPENFIQTHRSYIVNAEYIKMKYSNKIILTNGEEIPLSRTYKNKIGIK